MSNLSVLYVDDDPDIREIAEMCLSLDPNMNTRVADSGNNAIALVREEKPDIVLLDVMMPGMDGRETLSVLHQEIDPELPIIFVTARTHSNEVELLISLGAIGVIRKPFLPTEFASEVRAIMERRTELV